MAKQTAKKEWYIALKRCWHSAEKRWIEPGGLMDWSHLAPEKKAMHLAKDTGRPATDADLPWLSGGDEGAEPADMSPADVSPAEKEDADMSP